MFLQAQLLAQDDERATAATEISKNTSTHENLVIINGDDPIKVDDEIRRVLTDTLIDNALLRKQVNSVIRCAFKTVAEPGKDDGEAPSRKSVLSRFLER